MSDVPLIYTAKGNVPVDSLDYSKEWEFGEEIVWFREFWRDRETGEIVKNNVHGYALKGLPPLGAAQAQM